MPGLTNEEKEKLSKERAIEFWDSGKIKETEIGTYEGLRQIHEYLFQGFQDYKPGQLREKDLAKGNFAFCKVIFLEENIKIIDKMPENTYDEIIEKYVTMNILHPFYEGNGRSMRIWLDQMLKENLSLCVDWEKIDKEDYLSAMIRSPIKDLEISVLLKNALTEDIENREVYMRGIQQSYKYENIENYDINELDKKENS